MTKRDHQDHYYKTYIRKHKWAFWGYMLLVLAFLALTSLFTYSSLSNEPFLSNEQRMERVLEKTGLPGRIIEAYQSCKSKIGLDCETPIILAEDSEIEIVVGELRSIQGKWGGKKIDLLCNLPGLSVKPERTKDWGSSISGNGGTSTAQVTALVTLQDLSPLYLHKEITATIHMDAVVPIIATGVQKFKNQTSSVSRDVTFYPIRTEELKEIKYTLFSYLQLLIPAGICALLAIGLFIAAKQQANKLKAYYSRRTGPYAKHHRKNRRFPKFPWFW